MAMKMKASAGKGGDFERPEPGNQAAVLVAIVDLGTHRENFQGNEYDAHKVYFVWELTTQQMTGSQHNHVVGLQYSLSFGEKSNLRKLVSAWRGKPVADGEEFDLSKLLGAKCLLNVQPVEGKSYVKLDPVCATPLPKGMECPPAKRKPVMWEIDDNDQLPEHLDWLPFIYGESVQDKIQRSKEWVEKLKAKAAANGNGGNGKAAVDPLADETEEEAPF